MNDTELIGSKSFGIAAVCIFLFHQLPQSISVVMSSGPGAFLIDIPFKADSISVRVMGDNFVSLMISGIPPLALLFATTRSVLKSVKVPVVEVAKRTNRSPRIRHGSLTTVLDG